MDNFKTPGVYVQEISTLPASVAEVETAIPAFFGYTEKGSPNSPQRIGSLVEYQLYFGSAEPEKSISVTVSAQGDSSGTVTLDPAKRSKNILFYAMQLYFANGGGPCYIVSTGNFADGGNASLDVYTTALATVAKEEEPTLLLFPDASLYLQPVQYYDLMTTALMQCQTLGDRFAIIDVVDNGDPKKAKEDLRQYISANLGQEKYGAAYYPNLSTTLSYSYDPDAISINLAGDDEKAKALNDAGQKAVSLRANANTAKANADNLAKAVPADGADENAKKAATAAADTAADKAKRAEDKAKAAEDALAALVAATPKQKFATLSNALQNEVKKDIRDLNVVLPPSAAVAGVYANTDSTRGVWKAPANVSLNYVVGPTTKITDEDQKDLNVDVTAGKSINAIRSFTGKGTKIWGARTLAGNDNEWRYVNVRRFFNMVEESVKRSTGWAVFEPNDSNTWVKVRAMIENYLILKWKDGALAGAKPDDAFYCRVGLGQTMSPEDVLEGRMLVEIGMAVVRPAEFIILKFSHKLQTS
jgi:uncharacterized protein